MSLERLFPRPGKKIRYRPVSMQFFYMLFISRFIILLYLFCIQTCLYLFGHLLYTGTDLSLFVTLSSICWNRLVFICYAIFYILEQTCLYLLCYLLYTGTDLSLFVMLSSIYWNTLVSICLFFLFDVHLSPSKHF